MLQAIPCSAMQGSKALSGHSCEHQACLSVKQTCTHGETESRVGMRYMKEPGCDSENMADTMHPSPGAIGTAGPGERGDARAFNSTCCPHGHYHQVSANVKGVVPSSEAGCIHLQLE